MGLFEVCANIDPTHTVLIVRDSSGEVVHRIEKPPRWGLLSEGSIDFAALESALLTLGYHRAPDADWVTGHWSAHTLAEAAPGSRSPDSPR
ncbi:MULTISPECIES: hypothetical protein [Rhodococcus]|uniref:Uncharacterized protein n=1 Tax=Rhodococcus opacus RKJ300 = JCM 13270 TaxID=1165867 RepID=I0WRW1_RHOOP|nr:MULTISPECIES: hypothetical protein [Rhodococcus]EID79127.1 hypothetical protein W59_14886 [Rhodococcus opacus RKJ300 = JCM 13270]QQZ17254.1 hypothetical protein GO592_14695 [Rhodococcus sp. 21391]